MISCGDALISSTLEAALAAKQVHARYVLEHVFIRIIKRLIDPLTSLLISAETAGLPKSQTQGVSPLRTTQGKSTWGTPKMFKILSFFASLVNLLNALKQQRKTQCRRFL